jgi:hypothetical protein
MQALAAQAFLRFFMRDGPTIFPLRTHCRRAGETPALGIQRISGKWQAYSLDFVVSIRAKSGGCPAVVA